MENENNENKEINTAPEPKPAKKKSSRIPTPLFAGIMVVLAGVLLFSAYKIYETVKIYKDNENEYSDIAGDVIDGDFDPGTPDILPDDQIDDPDGNTAQNTTPKEPAEPRAVPTVNIAALKETNPDAVAWLFLPNTYINYPVVQGTDNEYYLKHTIKGKENAGGCIFVDYRNASGFKDRNTLVYGHHMKDGRMFTCLKYYKNKTWYQNHPVVFMTTDEGRFKLVVFAAYTTKSTSDAYTMRFASDDAFQKWIDERIKLSTVKMGVEVTAEDRIVTFSTCAYNYEDARFVVHMKIEPCTDEEWMYTPN